MVRHRAGWRCGLGLIIATTAQATPELKAATYPVAAELLGGAGELIAGADAVKCEKVIVRGEITSATLGAVESRGRIARRKASNVSPKKKVTA